MTPENKQKVEALRTLMEAVTGKKIVVQEAELVDGVVVPKKGKVISVDDKFQKEDRSEVCKSILNRKME